MNFASTISKGKLALQRYITLCFKALVICLVLRVIAFIQIQCNLIVDISFLDFMGGYLYDIIFCLKVASCLLLPFVLIFAVGERLAKILFSLFTMTYVVVHALLMEYLCKMHKPLDQIIFAYSPEEIVSIINASVEFSVRSVIFFSISVLISLFLLIVMVRSQRLVGSKISCLLALVMIMSQCVDYKRWVLNGRFYSSFTHYALSTNQMAYAYYKVTTFRDTHFIERPHEEDLAQAFQTHCALNPDQHFVDVRYPFSRLNNDPDVLGGFIRPTDEHQLPNLVFIIIEGLGQKLTAVEQPSISFTPYIDSLASQGLYWKNCLSTAERTFEVLPSIFASAPYGTHGFANAYYPIPKHQSLLKELADNNYQTSFFYGGSSSFDGQKDFLIHNKINYLMSPQLDTTAASYKAYKQNNRWGLDDRETFRQAMAYKSQQPHTPFADIYLTLTTHEPFNFPGIDPYLRKVKKMLAHHTFANKQEMENIKKNPNIFACFLYIDDCVRTLINEYKKNDQFDNTLFIICGDHRMSELGSPNQLQKYHVPLIIYSNLIKEGRTMEAVVSHLDITPTLSSYLKHNYEGYKVASTCHWLGSSLDTCQSYRIRKTMPFILNNRDIEELIKDSLFVSHHRLFRVGENLTTTLIEDATTLSMMENYLAQEKFLHQYTVYHNCLTSFGRATQISNQEVNFDDIMLKKVTPKRLDRNVVAYVSAQKEYSPLCHYLTLTEAYEELSIELQFGYEILTKGNDDLFVVLSITNDRAEDIFYESWTVNPENQDRGEKNTFILNENFYLQDIDTKGCELRVYLYNCGKHELIYDNILFNLFR